MTEENKPNVFERCVSIVMGIMFLIAVGVAIAIMILAVAAFVFWPVFIIKGLWGVALTIFFTVVFAFFAIITKD